MNDASRFGMAMVMDHRRDIIRDVDTPDLDCEETLESVKASATKALGLIEAMLAASEA